MKTEINPISLWVWKKSHSEYWAIQLKHFSKFESKSDVKFPLMNSFLDYCGMFDQFCPNSLLISHWVIHKRDPMISLWIVMRHALYTLFNCKDTARILIGLRQELRSNITYLWHVDGSKKLLLFSLCCESFKFHKQPMPLLAIFFLSI